MGGSCINRKLEHLDVYCIGWQVQSSDEAPKFCRELLDGFRLSVFTVWFLSLGVHAAVLWKFSRLCSNILYTQLNNPFLNIAF